MCLKWCGSSTRYDAYLVTARAMLNVRTGVFQRLCAVVSVVAMTLGVVFSPQHVSGQTLRGHVYEKTLANGLKVLVLENHKAPTVAIQVWYRVGSRNERWGKTGLSHVLEHMMFKGRGRRGTETISRIIQEHGGNCNAFTTKDYTVYFEVLSADRIDIALALESERMQDLVLEDADFQTELMVIMEERRLRTEDNPKAHLIEQVEATAFHLHPYHWPVIGWMEDLRRLKLDEVKAHYKEYYHPANAFIVIVGDVTAEEVVSKIEKAFGGIPAGCAPDQYTVVEPDQMGERRVYLRMKDQLPFLVVSYRVPNLACKDAYVLEVIAALLAGGKSSRLYRALVQDLQLALNVDVDYSLTSKDPGLFTISAELLPNASLEKVEKILDEHLQRLGEELVAYGELEKAVHQLEANFVFGQDAFFYQALLLGSYEIAASWKAVDEYLPLLREIQPADIKRVSRQYLVPHNRTVGILSPASEPSETARVQHERAAQRNEDR